MSHPSPRAPEGFVRGLGPFDATMMVAGSMVGSGIFIVSADMARQLGSPGWLLLVWLITGLLTVMAALSYGELAAMMPRAGGQYVYLREAYGPLVGFLYGWTLFTVIQTGTIAAVAVAFAKFLGVLWPALADLSLFGGGTWVFSGQQAVAVAVVCGLTGLNLRGLKTGRGIQNLLTVTKLLALLGLIGLGLLMGRHLPEAFASASFWQARSLSGEALPPLALCAVVGTAMVGSLFSADAWNNITFTAGEVREPQRTIPLSLALGTLLVIGLYALANLAYLAALPFSAIQHAPHDRVGTAALAALIGPEAAVVMAIAIMVSTFGCANGLVLAGARVYWAMARDGLFFRRVAELNSHGVPAFALILQGAWACVLTLSGRYGDLLDYVIFAALLFYVVTVSAVFVLRRTRPEAERPYRALGYPWIPALYVALASLLLVDLLVFKPTYTWPGLAIVLLGVPVYAAWQLVQSRPGRA
ncbi:MAG: APC family permease [Candidatus Sericytochromatia bacterium]|nr:APC family permease [Candidatus Sericytochromatia bacterium]